MYHFDKILKNIHALILHNTLHESYGNKINISSYRNTI